MSKLRERRLVVDAAGGNAAAREQLIEAFLPAIGGVARTYRTAPGVDHAELMQEGVVGLLRALRRYELRLNTPFWAYASWWVRQAMQRLVADLTRPVVLSDRAARAMAELQRVRSRHLQAHMREPTCSELARATTLPLAHVESLLSVERTPQSLEQPLRTDLAGAVGAAELLAAPDGEDAYERVIDHDSTCDVRRLTGSLGGRERRVLLEHYGVDRPPKTLREIGCDFGLSAERVRQIEERALERLRVKLLAGAPAAPS